MADPRSSDTLIAWSAAAAMLATVLIANFAPAARVASPPPASRASRAALPSPDQDPACREWTDACVVCVRGTEGVSCSTPGIACVREAAQCTRR